VTATEEAVPGSGGADYAAASSGKCRKTEPTRTRRDQPAIGKQNQLTKKNPLIEISGFFSYN
jgi:hypothetical protein